MSIYSEGIKHLKGIRHVGRILKNACFMFRAGEKAGKPFGIKFEAAAVCNLRCIMCPQSRGLKRQKGVLSFNNFKKVFDEVSPVYLNLTGIGEPLLNPELFKIIDYAKENGTIVKLDTNATLLDRNNCKKLLSVKPDIISVSIDGANKKSYEKIRVGAKFEVVMDNLKNLILCRNAEEVPTRIDVNFVLQKENIQEILSIIRFLDSLGVDSINGDIALPLGANDNVKNRGIDKGVIDKVKSDLTNVKTRASLNIEHVTEFLEQHGDIVHNKKKVCFYPWYYPSITWDGYLVPCCYICDNEVVFGNVFKEPFMRVWNNAKTRAFRKMIANKREGICENCFIDETYIANKMRLLHKIPLLSRFSAIKF